jgi:hypothetical protein
MTSDTLGQEAFPNHSARRASPTRKGVLDEQVNPSPDPDAAIGGRKQDISLLAVNYSGEAEIHDQ